MRWFIIVLLILLASVPVSAEAPPDDLILLDEGFLPEEGFSQQLRLVSCPSSQQWISTVAGEWFNGSSFFGATLSFNTDSGGTATGDLRIDYRRSVASSESWGIAPRLSLVLAEARIDQWRDASAEVNVPLSMIVSDRLVAHWNAGLAHTVSGPSSLSVQLGTGASLTVRPSLVLTTELLWSRTTKPGSEAEESLLLNPILQFELPTSGAAVTPAIAFPVEWSDGDTTVSVLLGFGLRTSLGSRSN